jgi:uncharacterized C2H2 Zn-finger protein
MPQANTHCKHEVLCCPRCGAAFECRMNNINRCHCVAVSLNREQLEQLAERFDSCLCHSCLQQLAHEALPSSPA